MYSHGIPAVTAHRIVGDHNAPSPDASTAHDRHRLVTGARTGARVDGHPIGAHGVMFGRAASIGRRIGARNQSGPEVGKGQDRPLRGIGTAELNNELHRRQIAAT